MSEGNYSPEEEIQESESGRSGHDIEQVRDLLFGDHTREYERRFRQIERHVEMMNNNLKRATERVDSLEREKTELQERLRDQQLQAQVNLEEVHRSLVDRVRQQQRDFDNRFEELFNSVHDMIEDLDGKKLSQHQMADMLVELGTRMKRSSQAPSYGQPRLTDEHEEHHEQKEHREHREHHHES
jgi:hypothetical protein